MPIDTTTCIDGLEECQMLSYMVSNMPNVSAQIPLSASLFNYIEDAQTIVSSGNIEEFLAKDWANISILQVYMVYATQSTSFFFISSYICLLFYFNLNFWYIFSMTKLT